jgi:F0F1-type ATP synthase membrane subunit b/b'
MRRRGGSSVSLGVALTAVLVPALPALAEDGGETFLGLPTVLWKTVNAVVFFGLLVYLLARPLARFFHARGEQIRQQAFEADRQLTASAQMKADMESRIAALEGEITALRERLRADGEREREALENLGSAEAARLLAQVRDEASRRVKEAQVALAREAADVAAGLAAQILAHELTPADRERIFTDTLKRLGVDGGGA